MEEKSLMADESSPLSLNKLGRIVKRLTLSNNSVLLIKTETALSQRGNIDRLSKMIGENYPGVIIIAVDNLFDLASASEEEMNALGWYRLRQIQGKLARSAMVRDALAKRDNENDDGNIE